MSEAIITSLITAATLIIVQVIISRKQQRVQDIKNEYLIKEVQDDIKRLETKQDKHNSLIVRMVAVERDQKTAFRLIDELKEREDRK